MTRLTQNRIPMWRLAIFAGMVLLICAPLVAWALRVPELNVREMRPLVTWPDWRATKPEKWPAAFEAWLGDHFPARTRLIQWYGLLHHRWLGEPSALVVVGRDDWLFYVGENTVPDLVGRDRLSEVELMQWQRAVEGRRAWWRERGAEYLLVLVPNKSTVYPERLPGLLRLRLRPGKMDQLTEYFRSHDSPVPVLDLRAALLAAKARQTVYWPTDSHWNAEGLVAGSEAIMAKLRAMGVPPGPRDEVTWTKVEHVPREGDCIRLLTLSGRWPLEPVSQLRLTFPPDMRAVPTPLSDAPTWTEASDWAKPRAFERDSGAGRVVMLCDSFFRVGGQPADVNAQAPLILNFGRFVSLWNWIGGMNLATYEMLADVAARERPTLVIEQWTERYLRTPPPDHPEFQRARAAADGR